MRPFITLLTSTELQAALGNDLSDDELDDLRAFRDTVQEEFRQHLDAVSVMEELYGKQWETRDLQIWVVENGDSPTTSSPILLNEDSEEEALFATMHMLAKNLIRQNPADTDLLDDTTKLDAVSATLARQSLSEVMQDDRFDEVMETVEGDDEHWEQAAEYVERWSHEDQTLIGFLDDDG